MTTSTDARNIHRTTLTDSSTPAVLHSECSNYSIELFPKRASPKPENEPLYASITLQRWKTATAYLGIESRHHCELTMTVAHELTHRGSNISGATALALEDRFEVLKEIGDGSFGSVVLARVRTAGANVARRGTVVSGLGRERHVVAN